MPDHMNPADIRERIAQLSQDLSDSGAPDDAVYMMQAFVESEIVPLVASRTRAEVLREVEDGFDYDKGILRMEQHLERDLDDREVVAFSLGVNAVFGDLLAALSPATSEDTKQ